MHTRRCYGGPLDGEDVTVKYETPHLIADAPQGGLVSYELQCYHSPKLERTVTAYVFGEAREFEDRVRQDLPELLALESKHTPPRKGSASR